MRMMHHVKVFSLDGYIGSSPIQTNADVLGLNLAVEEHAAATFRRGTTMSGVIERPKEAATIKSQDAIDRLLAKMDRAPFRYSQYVLCGIAAGGHELQTTVAG